MDKNQNSQFNMLFAVVNHFDSNAPLWSSNVLISDAKADLSAKITEIITAAGEQQIKSTGMTMDKAEVRKDLETKALFISKAICAFTILNPGQKELYNTVYIAKTSLSRLREADLLLYVERLHEAALSVLESLAPYGVSEATIAALMGVRAAFYDIMTMPAVVISGRKDATEEVSVLMREAVAILSGIMDRVIDVLRDSHPEFVNVYFNVRKIHNTGKRTMSLEITTVNAADKAPLADAKIVIVGKKIKRISSENGQNRVQNLKEGFYTLSVSHPDFVPQLVPFTIMSGKTTEVFVEMVGVPENLRI